MAAPVEILFSSRGVREVLADMGSVQKGLERLANVTARTAAQGAAAQTGQARKASAQVINVADRERAAKEKQWAAYARFVTKTEAANAAAAKKASAERVREAEREASRKESLDRKYAANRERIVRNSLAMEDRARQASARASESLSRARGGMLAGAIGRGAGNVLGGAAKIAGAALAIGGGFTIADSLGEGLEQERMAGAISRGAKKAGKAATDPKEIIAKARAVAVETSVSVTDALSSLDEFVKKTGDLEGAQRAMKQLARLSAATGTSMADMSSAAAGVSNQIANIDDLDKIMRSLAGGGKEGAIEFRDLATYVDALASQVNSFAGDKAENLMSLGAVAQMARAKGGATSAAEATTSIERFVSESRDKSGEIKKQFGGFDTIGNKATGGLKDVDALILGVVAGAKGNMKKIGEVYGERSVRAVQGFAGAYNDAGGGAKGEAAVRSALARFRTPMAEGDIASGAASRNAETNAKLTRSIEAFKIEMQDKLMPVLPGLVDQFARLVPALSRFLELLINNPLPGLGVALAASVAKEVAAAQLGKILANALSGGGGGGGGGLRVPVPGGAGGARGLIGALGVASLPLIATEALIQSGVPDKLADKFAPNAHKADNGIAISNHQGRNAEAWIQTVQKQIGIGPEAAPSKSRATEFQEASPLNPTAPAAAADKAAKALGDGADKILAALTTKADEINAVALNGGGNAADPKNPARAGVQ